MRNVLSFKALSLITMGAISLILSPLSASDAAECKTECASQSCCMSCLPFPLTGDATLAFDNFRSLPDGSWNGNMGAFVSLNLGMPFPWLVQHGLGIQLGGSYGVYDWSGRGSGVHSNNKALQRQTFITAGIFRKTLESTGLNLGATYDWMNNNKFGALALDPDMSQVRLKVGYSVCENNEFGLWSTIKGHTAHERKEGIPVKYRAISQMNLFWQHRYKNHATTMIWLGKPYRKSMMFSSGKAGKFIVGASFKALLSCRLSMDGHASYMQAKSASSRIQSRNYAANVSFGVTYSFGGTKESDVKKDQITPYLPIADNSNFIVDTNLNF